jgi:hypothetical protein
MRSPTPPASPASSFKAIKTDAAQAAAATEGSFRKFSQAAQAPNSNVIQLRSRMQQLGFQAQDFAVQVAGGTSAMRALGAAGDESVSLEDRMTALTDALGKVKQAAELQGMSIDELTARYGGAGEAVRKLIAGNAQLAVDEAARSVRELQKSMDEAGQINEFWNKWLGPDTEYRMTRTDKVTPLDELDFDPIP